MPLYLLPNVFSDDQDPALLLPMGLSTLLSSLTGFIAESERTGRRYLIKLLGKDPLARNLPIFLLNEHTSSEDLKKLGDTVLAGGTFGLISDAGMPGIADPGSELVHYLRRHGEHRISVIPGPSSIFLALITSGLPGQRFSFHGYLPKEKEDRLRKIQLLEKESYEDERTQIFIEAPYRTEALLQDFLSTLHPETELALVSNVTLANEKVFVCPVKKWRGVQVEKQPTVFLFFARRKFR